MPPAFPITSSKATSSGNGQRTTSIAPSKGNLRRTMIGEDGTQVARSPSSNRCARKTAVKSFWGSCSSGTQKFSKNSSSVATRKNHSGWRHYFSDAPCAKLAHANAASKETLAKLCGFFSVKSRTFAIVSCRSKLCAVYRAPARDSAQIVRTRIRMKSRGYQNPLCTTVRASPSNRKYSIMAAGTPFA